MLMTRTPLPIERRILQVEQDTLPRGCVMRLAENPPFYRCSCGARYDNPGQHSQPDASQDQPAQQYPFDA